MKTLGKVFAAAVLLSLTACQNSMSGKTQAMQVAERYVSTVTNAFPKARGVKSRGLADTRDASVNPFGGDSIYSTTTATPYFPASYSAPGYSTWNQWGGQWSSAAQYGTYGNYLMYPSMVDETFRCQQMVNAIPEKIEYLEFMVGTLERCLFRLAVNKSAPMNYLWRSEDPQILNYGGYLNDYARPAQYGNYSQDMYLPFLLSGQSGYVPVSSF